MPNRNRQNPSLITCGYMVLDIPIMPTIPFHCQHTRRDYHPFRYLQKTKFRTTQTIVTPLVARPTYVLNESLCSSQKIHHEWKTRSKSGMYLVQSPFHNHGVALVLNRNSILVRPQFHVRYDPLFTTNKDFDSSSLWQVRVGFFRQAGHIIIRAYRSVKRAALSTHPYQQEGGKRDCLDPSSPSHHSQPGG